MDKFFAWVKRLGLFVHIETMNVLIAPGAVQPALGARPGNDTRLLAAAPMPRAVRQRLIVRDMWPDRNRLSGPSEQTKAGWRATMRALEKY